MQEEEIEGYIAGIFKNPKIEAGAGVKTIPAVVRGRILATSPTKRFGVFRDALLYSLVPVSDAPCFLIKPNRIWIPRFS
jgi:hypothetical protein